MAFCRATQLRAKGAGVNFKAVSVSDKIALKATQCFHAVQARDVEIKIKVNKK